MPKKFLALIGRPWGAYALLILCVLVIGVIITGLNTVPGIILAYLAATILVVTLTHTWRKIKKFLILLVASLFGIFFLSFLHESVYGLAVLAGEVTSWQKPVLDVFHVTISIIVAFVCPVGMLIGAVGSVVLYLGRGKTSTVNNT